MTLPERLPSLLTRAENSAVRIKTLPTAPIIEAYRQQFGYDASVCFNGLAEIGLYRCKDTALEFFWPLEAAAPESLYRTLEQFDWNYQEGKWEHKLAVSLIDQGQKVLDVGCGRGAFLARARDEARAAVTGLEFNRSAVEFARGRGLDVRPAMIQEHAATHAEHYDVVASFQVLEHVTDPRSFLAGCVEALRVGGQLILGVPNADSFLRFDEEAVLNGPPHHMALWCRRSLESLTTLFPLRVRRIEVEPLHEEQWYCDVMARRYIRSALSRRIYHRFGFDRLFAEFVHDNAATIHGHTIVAVFEKT